MTTASITTPAVTQPEITFRWCRTERCQAQEVWLVLTSVTGTQVCLSWQPHLGWYEAPPTPVPCGLHTGFLHAPTKGGEGSGREWAVDAFHVSPHRAAVELFVSGPPSGTFLGHAPELRRRYLQPGPNGRRWRSSTALPPAPRDAWGDVSPQTPGPGGLRRGSTSASLGDLRPVAAAAPSPAFSRAFRVAAELSSTSSRLLAGLSSGSSGVCLAGEEAASPRPHHHHHPRSSSSPSPDSEEVLGVPRERLSRARRRRGEGDSSCPEVEVDAALSAARTSSLRTEAALLRLDTLAQERRVARLLAESESESDSDFEEEEEDEGDGEGDEGGSGGQYGCVITFESRSSSLQDVGSPRALEDALVSLTSTDSHPEFTFEGSRSSGPPSVGGRGGLEPPTPAPRRLAWGSGASPDLAEDQDFQYESLAHDDHRLPLRLAGIDSEDSTDSPRRRHAACTSPSPSPRPDSAASGTTGHYSPHATTPPAAPPPVAAPPSPPAVSLSLESYEPTVREVKVAPLGGRGAAPGWEEHQADTGDTSTAEQTAAVMAEEETTPADHLTGQDHDGLGIIEAPDHRAISPPGERDDTTPSSSPPLTPPLPGSSHRQDDTTTTPPDDEPTTTAEAPGSGQDTIPATVAAAVGAQTGRGGVGTSTGSSSTAAADDSQPGGGSGGGLSGRGGGLSGRGGGEDRRDRERGGGGGGGGRERSHGARRPPSLQHAGTQTPAVTSTTRATSTVTTTTRRHSPTPPSTPSPTRLPPRPHRPPFTPLPDRLSGPWNHRPHHTHVPLTSTPLPPPHYPPSPARSVLAALQQSLYARILQRTSLQDSTHLLQNSRLKELQKDLGLTSSHHLHSRRRPQHSPTLRAPLYPVLRADSVLSSTTMAAAAAQHHLGGSAGDLQRQHSSALAYTSGIRVRGSASLPDLYPPPPTPPSPSSRLPRRTPHNPSPANVMYSSGMKERRWSSWRSPGDSDSGGSTDSLIDEAEQIASSSSAPLDFFHGPRAYEFGDERRRRQRRHARRRTRSHHGTFTAWQPDATTTTTPAAVAHGGSGRPYLPYRGDQLSPGQQVKVLAPGGGVAVARVIANQRGSPISKPGHYYYEHEDKVTVVLLCEPNRLQGSVITVPLDKVLLAWPRA